eukprot:jgi/Pico_ML_1/51434/g2464.t1
MSTASTNRNVNLAVAFSALISAASSITKLYTIKQSVYVFSSAVGPALSLGMYLVLGNNWSLWPALTLVLGLSGAMMLAPAFLLPLQR